MSSLLIRPLGVEPGISIQLDALKEECVRNIILVELAVIDDGLNSSNPI